MPGDDAKAERSAVQSLLLSPPPPPPHIRAPSLGEQHRGLQPLPSPPLPGLRSVLRSRPCSAARLSPQDFGRGSGGEVVVVVVGGSQPPALCPHCPPPPSLLSQHQRRGGILGTQTDPAPPPPPAQRKHWEGGLSSSCTPPPPSCSSAAPRPVLFLRVQCFISVQSSLYSLNPPSPLQTPIPSPPLDPPLLFLVPRWPWQVADVPQEVL